MNPPPMPERWPNNSHVGFRWKRWLVNAVEIVVGFPLMLLIVIFWCITIMWRAVSMFWRVGFGRKDYE